MNSSEALNWINARCQTGLRSISEASSGLEICNFLISISGFPQYKNKITPGTTPEQKVANFRLASEIYNALGLEFTFDMDKLASGDQPTILSLICDLASLEEDDHPVSDGEPNGIDSLLDSLESDLSAKLGAAKSFNEELNQVAVERDFYLNKLIRMEQACSQYPPAENEAVMKLLTLSSVEFKRADE